MIFTLLALSISAVFGFLACSWIVRDASLGERIALGYGLGIGLTTLLMFVLAIVKVPIRERTMIPVMLVVLGSLSYYIWGQLDKDKKIFAATEVRGACGIRVQLLRYALLGGIATISLTTMIIATYWPVITWDSLTEYDFRGRAFIHSGDLSILASNPYYGGLPILTSLIHSWVYLFGGNSIHMIYWCYYICLLVNFYFCLKNELKTTLALLFTLLLSCTPILVAHSARSTANLPFTYYYSIGTLYLYIWIRTMRIDHLVVAGSMIGLSSWVRAGAEPYLIINCLVLIFWCVRTRQWKPVVYFSGILATIYLSWKIYQSLVIPRTGQFYEGFIVFEVNIQRSTDLVGFLIEFFMRFDLFSFIWPLFFTLALCSLPFGGHRSLILLFSVLADLVSWYTQFYLIHAATLEYFTRGSGDRLLMTYVPVALFYCAVCPALRLAWEPFARQMLGASSDFRHGTDSEVLASKMSLSDAPEDF